VKKPIRKPPSRPKAFAVFPRRVKRKPPTQAKDDLLQTIKNNTDRFTTMLIRIQARLDEIVEALDRMEAIQQADAEAVEVVTAEDENADATAAEETETPSEE